MLCRVQPSFAKQKTQAVVLPVATCFAHKSQATFFGRFVACRSLFVASAWAVNDSLRSNMSPAFRRIARHALCGGVTQPFRPWRRITFAAVNHSESNSRSNLLKTALYERELLLAANEEKERGMFERWESSIAR